MAHGDQSSLIFSGVFCIVWIGEAAVTLQIKLLGGKMYVYFNSLLSVRYTNSTSPAPSSSRSVSSVTRSSRLLSPPFSVHLVSPQSPEYQSIWSWWHGRWLQASASWAARELFGTGWALLCTRSSCSISRLDASVSLVRVQAVFCLSRVEEIPSPVLLKSNSSESSREFPLNTCIHTCQCMRTICRIIFKYALKS